MTQVNGFGDKVSFVWSIADLLRGDVKAHEYGQFILPFVVLRRLDCVLEPTKAEVIARAKSLEGKVTNVDPILERVSGAPFYNVSPLTFTDVLNDDKNVRANLTSYLAGFSSGAADVLEKYKFAERIATLDKAGLLYQVVAKFADIDLHPDAVPNHAMGYIFEELLRRFSEMANETAGEHFTPREVVKLMVNILFVEDEKALSGTAPVRTMFDPACGTGGLLSSAQDYLSDLNSDAHLEVYGQELNPETWAICRSDMLIKGEKPENIVFGNSLSADGHPDDRFDYMLANPPFGVKWEKYAEPILAEAENEGFDGRFGAGLPRSTDGSLLFLQHMISKMKPVADDPSTPDIIEGGSRLAVVFSGSPLFTGAAGSGESNIRKWIIENDWLEAVVALPDQLFYNTGISTYFWVLTNRKRPDRRGKVLLLDARGEYQKMRKSLNQKRKYISDEAIAEVTRLYMESADPGHADARTKVLPNEAFGFQRVIVEQPLRRRWVLSREAFTAVGSTKAWARSGLTTDPQDVFDSLLGQVHADEKECLKAVQAVASTVPLAVAKELVKAAAVVDPQAPVITDRKSQPLPDPDLRDAEAVPLPSGFLDLDDDQQAKSLLDVAEEHLRSEIHPYASEAWIDHAKTKVGYEIPLTRHFYAYSPPRSVADLDAEIAEREARIRELLGGLG